MALAHPVSATPTSYFDQPAIAVSFALAKPGETIGDFQLRINSRGEWGQTRFGRDKVELVLTKESVERLVEIARGVHTPVAEQQPAQDVLLGASGEWTLRSLLLRFG